VGLLMKFHFDFYTFVDSLNHAPTLPLARAHIENNQAPVGFSDRNPTITPFVPESPRSRTRTGAHFLITNLGLLNCLPPVL
jgi:hypothetical protein